MTTGVLALLEVLLIFGGALAFALYQLYQLRADKRRAAAAQSQEKPGTEPPPRN